MKKAVRFCIVRSWFAEEWFIIPRSRLKEWEVYCERTGGLMDIPPPKWAVEVSDPTELTFESPLRLRTPA